MKTRLSVTMHIQGTVVFLTVIAILILAGCNNKPGTAESASPAANPASAGEKAATSVAADTNVTGSLLPAGIYEKLTGKWIRADGSYTIEVFSAKADGTIDAGYFKPGPINVEKSEWKVADNKLYMRVILKDVNYPGSTYTLIYAPDRDILSGNYFQAVEGINYDVIFQRVK